MLRQTNEVGFLSSEFDSGSDGIPRDANRRLLNLALIHHRAGRLSQAEMMYRRILSSQPSHAYALNLLGTLNHEVGRIDVAIALISKAISIEPCDVSFHNNLGVALKAVGRLNEALKSFRYALAIQPNYIRAHSNLLVALEYVPGDRQILFDEASAWGAAHAEPVAAEARPHSNVPDPGKRLRIGYVSGELYQHPIGYFLEAAIRAHSKAEVEVFCYANGRHSDDLTERLVSTSDHWRELVDVDDRQAVELIRADGIDILIDLSGHVGNHRLLVFARKPAPIQASWLGYLDTMGMQSIDYIIADRIVLPEEDGRYYIEQIIRLPDCFQCYRPPDYAPDVAEPPSVSRGYVTFGCFDRASKINEDVVRLWAEILRRLPESRLCLKGTGVDALSFQRRCRRLFMDHGVTDDRLKFLGPSPHARHLAAHAEVDIGLNPFPFSGDTTTAEALWMGVPVVTLSGDRFVSRTTSTIVSAVGLDGLIADSPRAYIENAIELATDIRRLVDLRAGLRQRVAGSPLCDGPGFAKHLEFAFRQIWREWCRIRDGSP